MATNVEKAKQIYREEGSVELLRRSVRFGYDSFVRAFLPTRVVTYNEVPVRAARLGDSVVPWRDTDISGYEEALVNSIRECVDEGDTVTIIGGGWGVTTVVAARCVKENGHVTTYEGASETAKRVEETIELNGVKNRVDILPAVVGQAISLRGSMSSVTVSPDELSDCDVLILDCEGAEIEILSEMAIRPATVIVETHGMFDAPEEEVRAQLTELGYHVSGPVVAEERLQTICLEKGIFVLIASRD